MKSNEQTLVAFEKHAIRRFYDEKNEMWYFSVVDVVAALTDSVNPRDYWFKMKIRVKTEDGLELSTICRQLKMKAPDGKMRETDCANVEGLFRIIQSIPSPKAEPFKQWLAKVGYERIQDMSDPARSLDRARDYWKQHGRTEGTDYRERKLKDVIMQLEPGLFKKVTGLQVKDFELLVSLGVFNSALMNDAVYKFKRYEDACLSYTGINKHEGEDIGLYDTVLSRADYQATFVNEPVEAYQGTKQTQ